MFLPFSWEVGVARLGLTRAGAGQDYLFKGMELVPLLGFTNES